MSKKSELTAQTEAYLAKIRKTVSDSRNLVEAARLRIEETDRLLARQGTTRDEIASLKFTPEQREAVNAELVRMGLDPIEDDGDGESQGYQAREADLQEAYEEAPAAKACEAGANFTAGDADGSAENRKRRFNVMMQQFRM